MAAKKSNIVIIPINIPVPGSLPFEKSVSRVSAIIIQFYG